MQNFVLSIDPVDVILKILFECLPQDVIYRILFLYPPYGRNIQNTFFSTYPGWTVINRIHFLSAYPLDVIYRILFRLLTP